MCNGWNFVHQYLQGALRAWEPLGDLAVTSGPRRRHFPSEKWPNRDGKVGVGVMRTRDYQADTVGVAGFICNVCRARLAFAPRGGRIVWVGKAGSHVHVRKQLVTTLVVAVAASPPRLSGAHHANKGACGGRPRR